MTDGVVVVDKPAGWTSHDVVAKVRRIAGMKRVGHAGTLDPMATGVLVVGIGRATRLLGHLALTDKAYNATIRLGVSTDSDDADGVVTARTSAVGLGAADIESALAVQRGDLLQVPSSVSAVKVAGRRAYERVRAGETVELAPRRVHVSRLVLLGVRKVGAGTLDALDVDIAVECSTGTYVRAIARDVGAALDVGGHLTALRRTRVGPFDLASAHSLDELANELTMLSLAEVAAMTFERRDLTAAEAQELRYGRRLAASGTGATVVAAFDPAGELVALVHDVDHGVDHDVDHGVDGGITNGVDNEVDRAADGTGEPGALSARSIVVFTG